MYYLTYRNLDTGFIFNLGKQVKRQSVLQESDRLFNELGKDGRVMVILRDEDGIICDKRYPDAI